MRSVVFSTRDVLVALVAAERVDPTSAGDSSTLGLDHKRAGGNQTEVKETTVIALGV